MVLLVDIWFQSENRLNFMSKTQFVTEKKLLHVCTVVCTFTLWWYQADLFSICWEKDTSFSGAASVFVPWLEFFCLVSFLNQFSGITRLAGKLPLPWQSLDNTTGCQMVRQNNYIEAKFCVNFANILHVA